jgi:hypothetical protein
MSEPMRALTVRQPFAWAIAYGGKCVENRSRPLGYRGPVAIHAGLELHYPGFFPVQTPEGHAAAQALNALGGRSNFWDPRRYVPISLREGPHPGLALGAVIAVAEIAGCHHADECMLPEYLIGTGRAGCCAWAMRGQFHIELAGVRPLAVPVPCRGMLGLWRLPEDTESAVRAQLAGTDG